MIFARKKEKLPLVQAYGERMFWTKSGGVLGNLLELRDAVEHMDSETFLYHVSKEKNDFAQWICDVLGDQELAEELRGSRTQSATLRKINARLKAYTL